MQETRKADHIPSSMVEKAAVLQPASARIKWIDVARGIGMLLVIIGHASPKSIPPMMGLGKWIYSFHIPLFFFISGMMIKETVRDQPWPKFIGKTARSLLLPYAIFGVFAYIVWVLILRHFGGDSHNPLSPITPIKGLFYGTFDSGLGILDAPEWFFPCLFCTVLLYRTLPRIPIAEWLVTLLIFAFGTWYLRLSASRLPGGFDLACVSLIFFVAGQYFKKPLLEMTSSTQNKSLLVLPIIICLLIISNHLNNRVDIAIGQIGNPVLFIVGGLAGTLGTIILSFFLSRIPYLERALGEYLGQNTLIIFPLHLFCFSVVSAAVAFSPKVKQLLFHSPLVTISIYVVFASLAFIIINPVVKFLLPWVFPAPKLRAN